MELKTEQEHLRDLIDAISRAASIAQSNPAKFFAIHPDFTVTDFREQIRRASEAAASLNFYRNQRGWGQLAGLLDTITKAPAPQPSHWPQIAEFLRAMSDKAQRLANRRLN